MSSSRRTELSVLIPAYNEERTIRDIVYRVRALPLSKQIIVVDDGSTDRTRAILGELEGEDLKVIRMPQNSGKGSAIRRGLEAVRGDVVIIQDADLEYDPRDIPAVIEPIREGRALVVYGNRWHGKVRTSYRRYLWGGRLLTAVTNFLYGTRLHDEPTCYKAFRADLIKSLNLACEGFEFCPEVTAKVRRLGYNIIEVPISYNPRSFAEGKKLNWLDGLVAIWVLIKHKFTPLKAMQREPKSSERHRNRADL